jgi:predicted dehydrogenase/nucleoside-diphosphate-sugar epimerase
VGAGLIATYHLRALQRLTGVKVIGVCDLDRQRAVACASQFGVARTCGALDELLALGPDVVHVLTPPALHADQAVAALQAGCHVYVEKPLATSVEDCDRIIAAAMAAGRQVCVGHSLLYDPFVGRALKLARSGRIGRVLAVDHHRSQEYPPYYGGPIPYQYRDGGFPFRDVGVHSLYLIEAFLGPISSARLTLGPPENDGCPLFKEWRVDVECAGGSGHVYLSWNARPLEDVLTIHGTKGVIRADLFGMSVTSRTVSRLPQHAQRILNSVREGLGMATQAVTNVGRFVAKRLLRYHGLNMLVADFYRALQANQPAPVSAAEARNVVRWTEEVARGGDHAKAEHLRQVTSRPGATTLVTGATGFIGQHLLARLLETAETPIRVLTRYRPPQPWLDDPRINVVMGDLGDPQAVDQAMQGISVVYHLGAAVTGSEDEFRRASVAGTQNVVDSALRHGVGRLVHVSSLSVLDLGAAQNGARVDENWPLEPRPELRGNYSWTKLLAENCVRKAIDSHGLNAVMIRPGEVVAVGRPFLSGAAALETGGRFIMFGKGDGVIPVTWMHDLIEVLVRAGDGELPPGLTSHVVSANLSQREALDRYRKETNSGKSVLRVPLAVVVAAAGAADWLARRLGKSSPLSPYRLRAAIGRREFECLAPEPSSAKRERSSVAQSTS